MKMCQRFCTPRHSFDMARVRNHHALDKFRNNRLFSFHIEHMWQDTCHRRTRLMQRRYKHRIIESRCSNERIFSFQKFQYECLLTHTNNIGAIGNTGSMSLRNMYLALT